MLVRLATVVAVSVAAFLDSIISVCHLAWESAWVLSQSLVQTNVQRWESIDSETKIISF